MTSEWHERTTKARSTIIINKPAGGGIVKLILSTRPSWFWSWDSQTSRFPPESLFDQPYSHFSHRPPLNLVQMATAADSKLYDLLGVSKGASEREIKKVAFYFFVAILN